MLSNAINEAVELLKSGHNVCIPTETVYGLAGLATDDACVRRIFTLKGRPLGKALILHCHSLSQAFEYIEVSDGIRKLGEAFWPGPLTIVGVARPGCGLSCSGTAGGRTLAVRVPDCVTTLQILRLLKIPVFAPSANISNTTSATVAADVRGIFGPDLYVVEDDSAIKVGLESTIVDMSGMIPQILRLGSISSMEIGDVLGKQVELLESSGDELAERHYCPVTPLIWNSKPCDVETGDALLAFGESWKINCSVVLNLSEAGDLNEAAVNLYKMIRTLDAMGLDAIRVMPIPNVDIGVVINDRLRKASLSR